MRNMRIFEGKNGMTGRTLPTEDGLFRAAIVFYRAVPVEMIGCEVGDDGKIWAAKHLIECRQLEARKFENDPIGRFNLIQRIQQAAADVASQMRLDAGFFQEVMNQSRGG